MKLTPEELAAQLPSLTGWTHAEARGGLITKEFQFADFVQAFGFMSQCALVAERMDHHPEWFNVYSRVVVDLTTHDADGLSARDFRLAEAMDAIAARLAGG